MRIATCGRCGEVLRADGLAMTPPWAVEWRGHALWCLLRRDPPRIVLDEPWTTLA